MIGKSRREAKVKYLDGDFIIEKPGTHVLCGNRQADFDGDVALLECRFKEPYIDAAACFRPSSKDNFPTHDSNSSAQQHPFSGLYPRSSGAGGFPETLVEKLLVILNLGTWWRYS